MAKKTRDSAAGRDERAAADVLAGRTPVDAKRLIELIHAVNPTGEDLPAVESQRRYALKSRLQSLLIRRWDEDLSLEPDPADEGIVLLRHRFLGLDACHAAIDALDEDARSWVRLHLDLDTGRPAAAAPGRADLRGSDARRARSSIVAASGGGDPLQAGRQALEEFDYETARACFEGALDDSRHGLLAARNLLSMLVDSLGTDAEALAIEDRLPAEAAEDLKVRELLALAAARSSQPDRSQRLLKGIESPRSAEVLAILARDALGAGDPDEADRLCALARERDPALPELQELATGIEAARREGLRPFEDDAAAAWERGDHAGAEEKARAILSRWPASATARGIVRQIEEAQRRDRIRHLLSEAAQALGEERFESAATLLREASRLGEPDLEPRIAAAEAEARAASDALRLQKAAALLARPDRQRALEEFLGLDPELRCRALALATDRVAGWADAFLAAAGPRVAVQAAMALERALASSPSAEPEAIIDALAAHEGLVARVPEGKELLAEARAQQASRRAAAAEEQLLACRALLAAGDEAEALLAFDRLDRAALPAARGPDAEDLAARLAKIRERRELVSEYQRLQDRGECLDAIQTLEKLVARDPANGDTWRSAIAELRARLRREWLLKVATVDADLAETKGWWPTYSSEDVKLWLSAEGRLYLARCEGRWIFLRELDPRGSRVVRTAMLRAPVALGQPDVVVDGDTLWIADTDGIVQLRLSNFEVLQWKPTAPLVSGDPIIESVFPVPGSGLIWMTYRPGMTGLESTVFDGATWRALRHFKAGIFPRLLPGEAQEVSDFKGAKAITYSARGMISATVEAGHGYTVHAFAPHPSGTGFFGLTHGPSKEERELFVVNLSKPDTRRPDLLEDSDFEARYCLATSSSTQTSFVLFDGSEDRPTLAAYRDPGSGLQREYVAEVHPDSVLVQDAAGRHVFLVAPSSPGIPVVELGPTPPPAPAAPRPCLARASSNPLSPPFLRCAVEIPERTRGSAWTHLVQVKAASEIPNFVARFRAEYERDPEALMDLAWALLHGSQYQAHREVVEFAARKHPHALEPAMAYADDLVSAARFDEALEVLQAVRFSEVGGVPRHYHHLLGIARLRTGDRAGAMEAWRSGIDLQGECALDLCLAIADPESPQLPSEAWDENSPADFQVLGAVRAADALLEQGDVAGALAAISRPAVHDCNDDQAHARLVAALIQQEEPSTVLERFDMAASLARFVQIQELGSQRAFVRSMPLATAWSDERLAELADRARTWLEAFAVGDDSPPATDGR